MAGKDCAAGVLQWPSEASLAVERPCMAGFSLDTAKPCGMFVPVLFFPWACFSIRSLFPFCFLTFFLVPVSGFVCLNGNNSLGSGVIGGMIFGTLGILFFVPVFFCVFQYLQEKMKPVKRLPDSEGLVA